MKNEIFNMNPKRLSELVLECIAELGGEQGVLDAIRNQKVSLIEDIFKVGKCLNRFCLGYKEYLNPTGFMFDCLYDKDITDLELILAEMSAKLSAAARSAIEWKGVR